MLSNTDLFKRALRWILLAALVGLAPFGWAADAAEPDFIVTIEQGDTLSGLGQRWLAEPRRWTELQRHNKIKDPNLLVPGSRLAIPVALLREKPAGITVGSVSGQAQKADGTPVVSGERLPVGSAIKTADNGYVTIKLVDGSTLKLQSRSDLKIERARRLPGSDATDTQIQLQKGQAEVEFKSNAPKTSRFEIRTGFASAAVRGTSFRVAAAEGGTRTEVTEGTIAFAGLPPNAGDAAPTDAVPIPSGFGSIVDESRKPIAPVRLLDAPALPQEPVFQPAPALRLSFAPLEGAVSYRAWLAADAGFEHMVGEAVLSQPNVSFSGLKPGSYVLRVRATDKFGLEGRDGYAIIGMLPEGAAAPASGSAPMTPAPAKGR